MSRAPQQPQVERDEIRQAALGAHAKQRRKQLRLKRTPRALGPGLPPLALVGEQRVCKVDLFLALQFAEMVACAGPMRARANVQRHQHAPAPTQLPEEPLPRQLLAVERGVQARVAKDALPAVAHQTRLGDLQRCEQLPP